MRRTLAFFALLILAAGGVFAQTRESVRIYVQSDPNDPYGGFFRERFREEIDAAGYRPETRAASADYILNLSVRPNMIRYDDGTQVQAPPNEKQFGLRVGLTRLRDDIEIVSFSFLFTRPEEVDNHYLFYQVMLNLPSLVPEYTQAPPSETGTRDTPQSPWVGDAIIMRNPTREPDPPRDTPTPAPTPTPTPTPTPAPTEPEPPRDVPRAVTVEVLRDVPLQPDNSRDTSPYAGMSRDAPPYAGVSRDAPPYAGVSRDAPPQTGVAKDVPVQPDVPMDVPIYVGAARDVPVHVGGTKKREPRVSIDGPDSWRNKWLYLRVSADLPFSFFKVRPDQNPGYEDKLIIIPPGGTLGLEAQFLNWMSAEIDFVARFADVTDVTFNPGFGLQIKFPIKPARYFMLEPYLAAAYSLNTAPNSATPFYLEAGGGFQLGMKGGQTGAWFVDVNFMHTFNNVLHEFLPEVKEISTKSPEINWNRFVIGLGIGYKFGFVNRGK